MQQHTGTHTAKGCLTNLPDVLFMHVVSQLSSSRCRRSAFSLTRSTWLLRFYDLECMLRYFSCIARKGDEQVARLAQLHAHPAFAHTLARSVELSLDRNAEAYRARSGSALILQRAAAAGHVAILRFLSGDRMQDMRRLLGVYDGRGLTNAALRLAARNGHAQVLRVLREDYRINKHDALSLGCDALRHAARVGDIEVLLVLSKEYGVSKEELISMPMNGVRYFSADCDDYASVLTIAARHNRADLIRSLREDFAFTATDASARDNEALSVAVAFGAVDAIQALHQFGLVASVAQLTSVCQVTREVGSKAVAVALRALMHALESGDNEPTRP